MAIPTHFLFLLFTVMSLRLISWYLTYESGWDETKEQLGTLLMVLPLIMLFLIRWSSAMERPPSLGLLWGGSGRRMPDDESGGSSPWGVALMVFMLMIMVSYQSVFHDQWLPFWTGG